MPSVEYLRNYYPFDDDVMARVEDVAQGQSSSSWPEYASRLKIPDLKTYHPKYGSRKAIEVLDIAPKHYDGVEVYHMPMGCLLDANTMLHVATLAAAQPDKRVISVSNPGQLGSGTSKLSFKQRRQVAHGDLEPVVAPTLEYLYSANQEVVFHVGESYGADKAAASAEHSEHYDQTVPQVVMTEPPSVVNRGMAKTAIAFLGTAKRGDEYLQPVRAISNTFESAEELKESGMIGYFVGLARPSNIAIGRALGRVGFEARLDRAMESQPDMKASVIWGSESELALDGMVSALTDRLIEKHGGDRLKTMRLVGQGHAMNLDVFLNTAIILQSLKNKSS
jgi:hypothetical protein